MNVGIFTFARVCNYGAVLQAYALKTTLERLGHSAQVVDHTPLRLRIGDAAFPVPVVSRHPRVSFRELRFWSTCLPGRLRNFGFRKRRARSFSDFRRRHLGLSRMMHKVFTERFPYDAVVIGSDQVWNIGLTSGVDPYYWGKAFPAGMRRIGYAVSAGGSLRHVVSNPVCRDAVRVFRAIGIREPELKEGLASCLPDDSPVVLDPVLLLSAEDWRAVARRPDWIGDEAFAFLYRVADSEPAKRMAEAWSRNRGLRLVELCIGENYPRKENEVYGIPPEEAVWLFEHAQTVVSASFHGTAFSLLFGKPFLAFGTGAEGDGRLKSILDATGAAERFRVGECGGFPDGPVAENGWLTENRTESLLFLERNLTP